MTKKTLSHWTVTTGDIRESDESEVPSLIMDDLEPFLKQCLDSKEAIVPLPWVPGYGLVAKKIEGSLYCQVVHLDSADRLVVFSVLPDQTEENHFFWIIGRQKYDGPKPTHPFCAVRLCPDLNSHVDALKWLGDFERCIAWTWLKRINRL